MDEGSNTEEGTSSEGSTGSEEGISIDEGTSAAHVGKSVGLRYRRRKSVERARASSRRTSTSVQGMQRASRRRASRRARASDRRRTKTQEWASQGSQESWASSEARPARKQLALLRRVRGRGF